MRIRRATAAATLAIASLSTALLIAPSSAQASDVCPTTPGTITLFTKAKNVTFDVPGSDNWTLEISDLNVFTYVDENTVSDVEQLSPRSFDNSDAGLHDVAVTTTDEDGDTADCTSTVRLLRGANLKVRPTYSGSTRYFTGTLKRAAFDYPGGYVAFRGIAVHLQYLHGYDWITAKTVTTDRKGAYSTTIYSHQRVWRVITDQTSTTAAGSSPAYAFPSASSPVTDTAPATTSGVSKPKPKRYANCTALRKVYPHGVGRKGAHDVVRGHTQPVTNFVRDTKTYNLNKKSDRDKDFVACEQL